MSANKYSIAAINALPSHECFELLKHLTNSELCDPLIKNSISGRPYKDFIDMRNSFYAQFDQCTFSQLLDVMRANDVLGASAKELTGNALNEQIKSGIQNLSPYDKARLTSLNEAYKAKFSFNFICVTKNLNKEEILSRLEKRISNDFETEYLFSIIQLKKLLHLRLQEMVNEKDWPKEPSFFMEDLNTFALSHYIANTPSS